MADRSQLRTLALCAGGGGLDLGVDLALAGASRVICWVEWEAFAAEHLAASMEAGHVAPAPVWSDPGIGYCDDCETSYVVETPDGSLDHCPTCGSVAVHEGV